MDQLISYKEHLFINNVILNIFTVTSFQAIILILLHLSHQTKTLHLSNENSDFGNIDTQWYLLEKYR